MISRFEERYYNDINSLASTMPRVVELLEKLVDSKVPSTSTKTQHVDIENISNTTASYWYKKWQEVKDAKMNELLSPARKKSGSVKDAKQAVKDVKQAECEFMEQEDTPRQTVPGTRLASNKQHLMHSRPINWNPDNEYKLDLAVVFKNDKGELVVTPICTRCNYRYSAYSRNGTDWNCQNCGYEWQTNNNFSPFLIFNTGFIWRQGGVEMIQDDTE